jgi:phage recombination protein Bet
MSTQPQQAIQKVETSPMILELAGDWKISPATMLSTLKATIFKTDVSNEIMVSFLQVCNTYKLNPFVKEIYAFPGKGGGFVPMVPIDGWANIINRNPHFDGLEFIDEWVPGVDDTKPKSLFSTTCIIYRKDRTHPIRVTEYMQECWDGSKESWKRWPARMLRHKALIQCARIAFALAGIFDPDEAERIAESGEPDKPVITRPTRASATIDAQPVATTVAQAAVAEPTTEGASNGGSTAQRQPAPASSGCFCSCCKSGKCDCQAKDDFNRCGCGPCKFNVAAPPAEVKKEEPRPTQEVSTQKEASPTVGTQQPSGSELFGPPPGQQTKPAGPYVENKARTKLIIAAKAVGWNVQKDSHDDQLHKFLKERYAIESLSEVPAVLFDQILKEVGNSGNVKMNLK